MTRETKNRMKCGKCKYKKDVGNTREIQWVPVSEGYPDDARLVLVTLQYENGEYEIDLAEYWELNDYGMEKYPEEYVFGRRHKNVVAWADLPSPYIKISND